ncbi:hypothetical protein FRB94_011669 [Tulasnella sp. JGI-2019a]|nr:hypothetical protein FRB93_001061 [Tulasnella sp. JGI-2019a]KAG9009664.1 hypothetical protein FRB94_011669 [Tulasnella sp. JGI-2019a]KAG9034344.1 hypothetical protein FRB95_013380 [Tulasnella sp. JGI-2019a]
MPSDAALSESSLISIQQHGEVYCLKLAGKNVVVLSSARTIKELMEMNAIVTADRPSAATSSKPTEGVADIVTARNGASWRTWRMAADRLLRPTTVEEAVPLHASEAAQLADDILYDPSNMANHLSRFGFSIVAFPLFGNRIPSVDSPVIQGFRELWARNGDAENLGHPSLLDQGRDIKVVPKSWLAIGRMALMASGKQPGTTAKMRQTLFYRTLEGIDVSRGKKNDVMHVMERAGEYGVDVDEVAPFRGHLFEAGAATTGAFINNLIALLAENPRVQKKAHDEMNEAGFDQSPSPENLSSLPYLNAVVKEVMRLHPLKPFGVPHACTEDIQYDGHRIRKGTAIYVNIRGAYRDPEVFEQPEKFYPERYMESDLGIRFGLVESQYEILRDLSFGVGLRKCPGQHLATRAIIIAAAKLVWALDFRKLRTVTSTPSTSVSSVLPLDCSVEARVIPPKQAAKRSKVAAVKVTQPATALAVHSPPEYTEVIVPTGFKPGAAKTPVVTNMRRRNVPLAPAM